MLWTEAVEAVTICISSRLLKPFIHIHFMVFPFIQDQLYSGTLYQAPKAIQAVPIFPSFKTIRAIPLTQYSPVFCQTFKQFKEGDSSRFPFTVIMFISDVMY